MRGLRAVAMAVVVGAFTLTGCGEDDPAGPGGGAAPPDLSGSYTLQSFTQGGVTLTPPIVMGTFDLTQTASTDTEASGTFDVDITVPDGQGGQNRIVDAGTYTVRSNGTFEQNGDDQQTVGTYTLVGPVLTVTVTDPPAAASVTVWQR